MSTIHDTRQVEFSKEINDRNQVGLILPLRFHLHLNSLGLFGHGLENCITTALQLVNKQ